MKILYMVLNCGGKLLDLNSPKVMGVINLNQDSFYEGSRSSKIEETIQKANKMILDGAEIIDLGVMSSRPGAALIDAETEWQILEAHLKSLSDIDVLISVDTVWSYTAERAISYGAKMINDISASEIDSFMLPTIAKYKNIPYVMMHMKGKPENMQSLSNYDNFLNDILSYFALKIRNAEKLGINDLIIDPGFGFAKTLDQNFELLKNLNVLNVFNKPILAGLSRKSMLYKLLEIQPEEALNATTAVNIFALMNNTKILRVHDVKEATEAVKLFNKIYSSN